MIRVGEPVFLLLVKNTKHGYLYVSSCAVQSTVMIKTLIVATTILSEQDK